MTMGEGLKVLAQVFVRAALSLPKDTAVDIVHAALEKFEREVMSTVGADAKVIADGLRALAAAMSDIVRTKGPLVPIMTEFVSLEDTCRAWAGQASHLALSPSALVCINAALERISAARELPRGDTAEAG
jgi:hypothetical protein